MTENGALGGQHKLLHRQMSTKRGRQTWSLSAAAHEDYEDFIGAGVLVPFLVLYRSTAD